MFHAYLIFNDDEAERAARRSCSEIQRRVSNIGVLNRSISESDNNVSIPESSLEEHYDTCVKLFTQNKINVKNAWNIHIIEYMSAMLKKGLVMRDTLKLASTSLDISSKVYGLRVDDIHSDIFKFAGCMAKINLQDETNKKNKEADENNEGPNSDEGEREEEVAVAKKKKKRKVILDDSEENGMIAKNLKQINAPRKHCTNKNFVGAQYFKKPNVYSLNTATKIDEAWYRIVQCRTDFPFWVSTPDVEEKIDDLDASLIKEVFESCEIQASTSKEVAPSKGTSPFKDSTPSKETSQSKGSSPSEDASPFKEIYQRKEENYLREYIEKCTQKREVANQDNEEEEDEEDARSSDLEMFPIDEDDFPNVDNLQICPAFSDFTFDDWTEEDDEVPYSTEQLKNLSEEVIYDEHGCPIPNLNSSAVEIDVPMDNDDDQIEEMCIRQAGIQQPVQFITDMRPGDGQVSEKALQYSYRALPHMSDRYSITGVWAGPSHWKIKAFRQTSSINNIKAPGAARRARRVTRAEPEMINFNVEMNDEELFATNNKKITRSRNQIKNLDKFTLPEDMCVSRDDICCLSLRPWIKLPIGGKNSNVDLNISSYQYDNPNDADYCSQSQLLDVSDEQCNNDNEIERNDEFFENNSLIEEPHIGQTNAVSYSNQAKKIDIKKLKDAIWKSMVSLSSDKEIPSLRNTEEIDNDAQFEKVPFSAMYTKLPKYISTNMEDDLTCPLAFVALLHLANEHELKLEGQSDLLDLHITSSKK